MPVLNTYFRLIWLIERPPCSLLLSDEIVKMYFRSEVDFMQGYTPEGGGGGGLFGNGDLKTIDSVVKTSEDPPCQYKFT